MGKPAETGADFGHMFRPAIQWNRSRALGRPPNQDRYRFHTTFGTIVPMATNLRLRADAQAALREQADATGRSQQELIREAVDRYLGLASEGVPRTAEGALLASGAVLVARSEFRESDELLALPEGLGTLELLDRDDRI
jgi:hypothetical protein